MSVEFGGVTSIQNVNEKARFVWKRYSIKKIKEIVYFLVAGLAIAIYGFIRPLTIPFSSPGKEISYYHLNIFLTVGLGALFICGKQFKDYLAKRQAFFRQVDLTIQRMKSYNYFYRINETGIHYSNSELTIEMRWSLLTSYGEFKNGFYVLSDSEMLFQFIVLKSEVEQADYMKALNYIRKKLPVG